MRMMLRKTQHNIRHYCGAKTAKTGRPRASTNFPSQLLTTSSNLIERLGYSGMCLSGVRGTEGVSGFPAGIHFGASWNIELAIDRSSALGAEFKAKGGMNWYTQPHVA